MLHDSRGLPLIAVIDDQQAVCRALQRLIRSAGYAVATYSSGEQFLESLGAARPSCVLLDLHMPGLSGFDVMVALRRTGNAIPVIMLTADENPHTAIRAAQLGAIACLHKPVDASKLFEAVEAAVSAR